VARWQIIRRAAKESTLILVSFFAMAILEPAQDNKLRQLYIVQCLPIHLFPFLSPLIEHSLRVPRALNSFCTFGSHYKQTQSATPDNVPITLRLACKHEFTAIWRSL
jgi:hypothetical protein